MFDILIHLQTHQNLAEFLTVILPVVIIFSTVLTTHDVKKCFLMSVFNMVSLISQNCPSWSSRIWKSERSSLSSPCTLSLSYPFLGFFHVVLFFKANQAHSFESSPEDSISVFEEKFSLMLQEGTEIFLKVKIWENIECLRNIPTIDQKSLEYFSSNSPTCS